MRTTHFRTAFVFLLALAATAFAAAQRASWNPPGGALGFGKTSRIELVLEDCSADGEIVLPAVDGLHFGTPSISEQTTIVNFQMSRSTTLSYPVSPVRRGTVVIPAFTIATNKGRLTVPEARFEVGDAAVGQSGVTIGEVVEARLRPERTTLWVGEVVPVEYVLIRTGPYSIEQASEPDWSPTGFVLENFGEAERTEVVVRGERRPALRYRTRMMATEAGQLALPAVQQRIAVQTGERGSFPFSRPRIEEFLITSDRPAITVNALPEQPPAGFDGAVGAFQVDANVVPLTAHVGEPITWTLTLRGTGNWPANLHLPQREVSADFQVVQPKSRQELTEGKLFDGTLTEDAVLVPTRAGTYDVGPVSFSFFDPATGAYRTEEMKAVQVVIAPALATTLPSAQSGATQGSTPSDGGEAEATPRETAPPRALPADLEPPGALPRDPLDAQGSALAPFSFSPAWWLLVAFVPPAFTWITLAWRQAQLVDQSRERRAARRRLLRLLEHVQRSGRAPDAAALELWRQLVAQTWGIDRAAPTAEAVAAAAAAHRAPDPQVWAALWVEAEAALFGPTHALAADWAARAAAAARQARPKGTWLRWPAQLRFWAPQVTMLALAALCVSSTGTFAAENPARAYRAGRFAEARAAWLEQVARNPRDWAAHNNAALAFAQEENWPEAAAHWTAAFLLRPRESSIRGNLRLALSHLDGIDPHLRKIVDGAWFYRSAGLFSPAEWQLAFFAGAGIVAAGFIWVIAVLYWPIRRGWRRTALWTVFAGALVSLGALIARDQYGLLAEPDAGLVTRPSELRSIPTDLTSRQLSAPLPPGAVIVVKDSLLGWEKIIARGATQGWLRREAITPFFQAAPNPPGATPGANAAAPRASSAGT